MEKEKVEVRFFTKVIDADYDPELHFVNGVIISNIEGLHFVKAKAYIDCTGDAVLADKCGVEFDVPEVAMAPTLCARFSGIDWNEMDGIYTHEKRVEQRRVLQQAVDEGTFPFTYPDKHIPGLFVGIGNTALMNCGHVFGMNALDCRSLSDGIVTGRRLVQEYTEAYKTFFKEYKNMQLVDTGALMGVRDSRRIKGEYYLNYEDYLAKRKFPDQILINASSMDMHVRNTSKEEYERFESQFFDKTTFEPGEYFVKCFL